MDEQQQADEYQQEALDEANAVRPPEEKEQL
jgi:hypothetical protein